MIIKTESQARAYFDLINQHIMENVSREHSPGYRLDLSEDELLNRLNALAAEGILISESEGYRLSDPNGYGFDETSDECVYDIFVEYTFSRLSIEYEEAKGILASDKARFFSNIDVDLFLSSEDLFELKMRIVKLVQTYSQRNAEDTHKLCRLHVGFNPGRKL